MRWVRIATSCFLQNSWGGGKRLCFFPFSRPRGVKVRRGGNQNRDVTGLFGHCSSMLFFHKNTTIRQKHRSMRDAFRFVASRLALLRCFPKSKFRFSIPLKDVHLTIIFGKYITRTYLTYTNNFNFFSCNRLISQASLAKPLLLQCIKGTFVFLHVPQPRWSSARAKRETARGVSSTATCLLWTKVMAASQMHWTLGEIGLFH